MPGVSLALPFIMCVRVWSALVLAALGCSAAPPPDPRDAASRFAAALEAGDAERVEALLSAEAREALGPGGTSRAVKDARRELAERARAFTAGAELTAITKAEIRTLSGRMASLKLESTGFAVALVGGLPSRAESPVQALAQLREALVLSGFGLVTGVLAPEVQSGIELDIEGLAAALAHPEQLEVIVAGDRAEVALPFGYRVILREVENQWFVEDFR